MGLETHLEPSSVPARDALSTRVDYKALLWARMQKTACEDCPVDRLHTVRVLHQSDIDGFGGAGPGKRKGP